MILLYHLVFPDSTPKDTWNAGLVLRFADFKRQLLWLKRHFQIVSLDDYLNGLSQDPKFARKHFALTFDDGYQQVFDLVSSFLLEEKIPATFFVTTSHLENGELLWFVYFNALCSEKVHRSIEINGQAFSLTSAKSSLVAWQKLIDLARSSNHPIEFARQFAVKYPLPEEVVLKYMGISAEQIGLMGRTELFEVGSHTHSHPYLDQISKKDQVEQILTNKRILEQISNTPVSFFAYTGGVYNFESISAVKEVGFNAAFAIKPRKLGSDPHFEFPRTDIYSPSLFKFKIKALGLETSARLLLSLGRSG